MQELQVLNLKNDITLDSRLVSEMLDKKHSDLLRDIETYIQYFSENADLRSQDFFIKSSYKVNGNNKTYKNYQITKKGCEFLAHKLTGQKGTIFTAKYINAFEDLKQGTNKLQDSELIKTIVTSQQNMMSMIAMLTQTVNVLSKTLPTENTNRIPVNTSNHIQNNTEIQELINNQGYKLTSKLLTLPQGSWT
ncbi:phage regulatory protein Rha [Peptoanaerobacter stomatis]|uniref:Phage regulatory protein Rha n=1 Tax=Peptoanaerobacter stomatis TaxID=796937 RepID=J5UJ58_9FIRM|nr:Rha family transcriptional regulator [Peptoanaerobacter stomatis]EJU22944.1 phage regulatory protein Rha [Peptoanaerobacter stomatis]